MGLWRVIAKNELKRRTSKFRKNRLVFFGILYAILLIWAFILAPMLFDSFMPTLAGMEELQPFIVPAIALIIEYLLMIFFLMIMFYPLNFIYRQTEIGHKEMILAAPLTAGDIFFGEFIGKLPFMLIYVLIIAPAIVGLINPLVDLVFYQSLTIYITVFAMSVFALLLGSIISSAIEHKISKSEKAKDLGKALLMLFSIGMVAMIYALEFFFQYLMEHPEHKNFLIFYPAHWFSNIIVYILEPSLLDPYLLNIWTSLSLAIFVPLLIFFLSYKKAGSFYTLEGGAEKSSTIIENEAKFYGVFRKILGRKWEGLIIVQFKEFFRKKENISKLIYVFALVAFFGIVYPIVAPGGTNGSFMGTLVTMLMKIYMGGLLISIIFGGYIFVGSKDLLWVYKKSPKGVNGLVYSYVFMLAILLILMDVGLFILYIIFLEISITEIIVTSIAFLISALFALGTTIGVQCHRPAFEEKGKHMGGNMAITMILQIGVFMGFIFFMAEFYENFPDNEWVVYLLLSIFIGFQALIALPTFLTGLQKLKRIE